MTFTLKDLQELDWQERCKGTKMPPAYVPKNVYTDKTAGGLEKAICRFITLQGGQAERIKNQGRRIDETQEVTNVLGQKFRIGSVKYVPGTGTNGSADVHSTIPVVIAGHKVGIKVTWEVKIGKDTIKPDQLDYAAEVESAGGRAFFVRTFEDFTKKYFNLLAEFESK